MRTTRPLVVAVALAGMTVVAAPAFAQIEASADFPDVPQNHWAYQAVHELADKGLVKGYPDGKFLGDRSLTRYEFASVVVRLLDTIDTLKSQQPATPEVTQDDLNKIQVLVDTFRPELDDMKANITQAQADILTLRQNVSDLRQDLEDTKSIANQALDTANNSYGVGSNRKFQISGYVQARYLSGSSDTQTGTNNLHFTHGVGMLSSPYNGTYMDGSNSAGFEDRRTRLIVSGQATQNTKYRIQFDVSGNSNSTPVSIREGNIAYTFNNGDVNHNLTLTAGMFSNPFGYMLNFLPTIQISPERPVGFSEVADAAAGPGLSGIWAGDDYDKGAALSLPSGRAKFTVAALSGDGYGASPLPGTPVDHALDTLYKAGYNGGKLSGDVSYYNGHLPYLNSTITSLKGYSDLRKDLYDVDAQFKPTRNIFLLGEYEGGRYEERDYFADPTGDAVNVGNLAENNYVPAPGNMIKAYYIQGGYRFSPNGRHPFTLEGGFDQLNRSDSGVSATTAGGASGSSFDDVNWGYGATYNLDPQTRLRVWYEDPTKVAHSPTSADPTKVGLFTSELQLVF